MLYLILAAAGFFVQNLNEEPIPGAWVGSGGLLWFGFTDAKGYYEFTGTEPDTLLIHATGYADWSVVNPPDGHVVKLRETVFLTGESILVTASRGSLSRTIPSTATLGSEETHDLSTEGIGYLTGKVPGVSVREYGGSMPVVSVSIRGGDPAQVDYMIDGISIVSSRDGMPSGIFDPAVFSSIEIARGGAAAGGSGSGSSGAVNYLPPLSSKPFSFRVTSLLNGGTFFNGNYRGSAVSLRRNIGRNGTEGYSTTLLLTGRYANLNTGFLGAFAEGDVEGPSWSPASNGHRKQAQAECWTTLIHESFEFDVSAGTGLMDYRQTEPLFVDDQHRDLTARASLLWNGPLLIKGGFNSTWLRSTATENHSIQFADLHLAKRLSFLSGNLDCRLDADQTVFLSGRATAEHQLNHLAVFSSVFSDYRAPTINDLYWPSDGLTSGNPDLRSERSFGAEAGVELQTGLISGSMCGFASISEDLIIWLPDESGIWTPSNVSSSTSKGLELSGGFNLNSITLSGTFTWNIATDETDDTPREGMLLPYRPEYIWGVSGEIEAPWNTLIEIDLSGVGKRFTNRTQSEFISEYLLADASIRRHFSDEISIDLGMGNIFNTIYEETNGYTGRARSLRLTLEYNGE